MPVSLAKGCHRPRHSLDGVAPPIDEYQVLGRSRRAAEAQQHRRAAEDHRRELGEAPAGDLARATLSTGSRGKSFSNAIDSSNNPLVT